MTVDPNSIDLAAVMAEHLETAEPDLLRELLRTFVQALMSADADAACGVAYGTRSSERTNTRNGYRPRGWDTQTGSIELALPKLRQGSYFPEWLLRSPTAWRSAPAATARSRAACGSMPSLPK